MPIYEYEREDGTRFESIQKFSDEPLEVCPTTGQKVHRLISASAFHLKGGGWYKTDYNSSKGGSKSKEGKPDSSSAKDGGESAPSSDSCNGKGKNGGCSACSDL